MNAEQSIKRHILMSMLTEEQMDEDDNLDLSTADGVDAAYEQAAEYAGAFADTEIIDEVYEFRCSGQETNLPCEVSSRCYESEQVAAKLSDGSYVSWVYWTGGGKHGEPDAIDWMEDAFFVDCEEKQKMVTTYNFSKKTGNT
jgi:hypothetical protein